MQFYMLLKIFLWCWSLYLTFYVELTLANEMTIYNTKLATSDLQWESRTNVPNGGWEEVSSFDESHQSTIRSYQVCDVHENNVDNWIRSPYIKAQGGKQIYLDVEFFITSKCNPNSEKENSKCKETFNLFYYQADGPVASSTFPPWRENPYVKIDTVAANNAEDLNSKTFTFGSLSRPGFYIAVQDQGACMSLISLRVYYYYCPATTEALVDYPRTISDVGAASLVTMKGTCTANAVQLDREEPRYRCSSNGQWKVRTGECFCKAAYHSDSFGRTCIRCPGNTYKLNAGSQKCLPCPPNSGFTDNAESLVQKVVKITASSNQCPCHSGYARAPNENATVSCSRAPSQPISARVLHYNATTAQIQWKKPADDGGRNDLFYEFFCETNSTRIWKVCPSEMRFLAPTSDGRYVGEMAEAVDLSPNTFYRIKVVAQNGASRFIKNRSVKGSSATVQFRTSEAAPSIVPQINQTKSSTSSIAIVWKEPLHANGVILSYDVEIKDLSNEKQATETVHKNITSKSITVDGLAKDTEYQIRIRAFNSAGYGPYSVPFKTKTLYEVASMNQDGGNTMLIIAIACGIFFVIFLVVFVVCCKRHRRLLCLDLSKKEKKDQQPPLLSGDSPQDSVFGEHLFVEMPPRGHRTYVDYSDPLLAIAQLRKEISPDIIKIEETIGEGEFAEVCRGRMFHEGRFMEVAVKRLKSGATKKDEENFLKEASTMAQFDDPNVVQLKGAVTESSPAMIVTEYMENGSLDQYLIKNKGSFSILQLLEMLRGIASGMKYLSSINYIHRDLAARNILVGADMQCKVSDFGLSRTLENNPHATYTTQGGKIAIRWTALESILFRKFSWASDVWSFGIVMWEVMSYGEKPYWDMSNDDVIKNVQDGMRLPTPVNCPKVLHDLMLKCWYSDSMARPNFVTICQKLDSFLRFSASLSPDLTQSQFLNVSESAQTMPTPNLSRAMDAGQVDSVDKWLEIQRLNKYADIFKERGIDNLEKVSNLTLNDLKSIGIDVTLHINKWENGIRTLKRHLSTRTSTPPSSTRNSTASTLEDTTC